MARHLWILLVAGALSAVLCPLVGIWARRLGIVSQPVKDRWHREPTPLLGGLAIAMTAALAASGMATAGTKSVRRQPHNQSNHSMPLSSTSEL